MACLAYADDNALLAVTEQGLHNLLDITFEWWKAWHMKINTSKNKIMHFRQTAKRGIGIGGTKLCTYKLFEQRYETELYATHIFNKGIKSVLAKFGIGRPTAPIRLETGRYEGFSIEERLCQVCDMHLVKMKNTYYLNIYIYTYFIIINEGI